MAYNGYAIKLDGSLGDRLEFSGGSDRVGDAATSSTITTKSASSSLSFTGLTEFTFQMWVKPDHTLSVDPSQRALTVRQSWNSETTDYKGKYKYVRFAVVPVAGLLRFSVARVDGTAPTHYDYRADGLFTDDLWHHVALSLDFTGNTYAIVLDGVERAKGVVPDNHPSEGFITPGTAIAETESSPAFPAFAKSPRWVFAGWSSTDDLSWSYWSGKLDDIRLYSKTRSASEIAGDRFDHANTALSDATLVDEFRFNDGPLAVNPRRSYGYKNPSETVYFWRGLTLPLLQSETSALWTTDRPFLGDGATDTSDPTGLVAYAPTNVTTTGFTANWSEATDDVYVQYYQLTVATNASFTNTVAGYAGLNVGRATTWNVTGLTPNTTYYWRVKAFDAANRSSPFATYNSNAGVATLALGDTTAPTWTVASPLTSATNVTTTAFTLNWVAATDNVAVTGYKVDVATDADFTNYVGVYRNFATGSNATSHTVNTGLRSRTTYHARVRAVDAAGNESVDSNTLVVATASPPDTTPPSATTMRNPTGVGSSGFVANWLAAVDDVGVTGYLLDVATDAAFASKLPYFTNLNVGNVLAKTVAGLRPSTAYWYRVRAYDAAGNIGGYPATAGQVTTAQATIDGFGIGSTTVVPTADAEVRAGAATANYGGLATMTSDGTTGAEKWALLRFAVPSVVGTVTNAVLTLRVTEASAAAHTVAVVANASWDESTINWNTRPVPSGPTVAFYPTTAGEQVSVDIGSLVRDLAATDYTVVIRTASTDAASFSSREGVSTPSLVLEWNQQTATEVSGVDATASITPRTNLLKNPSAEAGVGGTTGVLALGASTVTADTLHSHHGTQSAKVVNPASGSTVGVRFDSATALGLTGSARSFAGAFHARANAALAVDACFVRLTYTDATTADGPAVSASLDTAWRRFEVPRVVADAAKTVDKVSLVVAQATASGVTFWADAAVVEVVTDGGRVGGYFDGTVLGAAWSGVANASSSVFNAPTVAYTATFLGDGDDDNSAVLRVKRSSRETYVALPSLALRRDSLTRQFSGTVGPVLASPNLLRNPSFETGTADWAASGTGASIARSTAQAKHGLAALAVTVGATADTGVGCNPSAARVLANEGEVWTAGAWLRVPTGMTAKVVLQVLASDDSTVVASSDSGTVTGDDGWQQAVVTATVPSGASHLRLLVLKTGTATGTFYVDGAQLVRSTSLPAYGDGDDALANLVANPSFENDTEYWTTAGASVAMARSAARSAVGSYSLAVAVAASGAGRGVAFKTTNRIPATAGLPYAARASVLVPTGLTVQLSLAFHNAAGSVISTATATAVAGSDLWAETSLTAVAPAGTTTMLPSVLTTSASAGTGTFYLDAVQVEQSAVVNPYTDGDQPDGAWDGKPHASGTWRVLAYQQAYDLALTVTDPDGVAGLNPFVASVVTPPLPTAALTTTSLVATPSDTAVALVATYTGDDDNTATAVIEWKRSDLSQWSRVPTIYEKANASSIVAYAGGVAELTNAQYDRASKQITATITDLTPGTAYDFRVTWADALVYGANPQLASGVLTTNTEAAPTTKPFISFGGFVLQGPEDHPYWVTEHDALSHPSRRVQIETLPRTDGGAEFENLWGTRTVSLRGGIAGESRGDLHARIADLRRAFSPKLQRLVIDTLAETNLYFNATCTSLNIREVGGVNFTFVLWDAEFACADPFRYESDETVVSSVEMQDGATLVVTNGGDLAVDPLIDVTTDFVNCPLRVQVSNLTTGERIAPSDTITQNQTYSIDSQRLTLTRNGVETDYAGGFPRLAPGDNTLAVTVKATDAAQQAANPSVLVSVRHRNRYL